MDRRIRTSIISIGANIVLISILWALASLTGSNAIGADALHSLSDLFVSLTVMLGILFRKSREKKLERLAAEQSESENKEIKPKNAYWVESLVAYLVSLIILYMPYQILVNVSESNQLNMDYAWIAIIGIITCIAITYFISRFKLIVGHETDSIALEADGQHSRMDMYTSFAVLLSLVGQIIGINLDNIVAVIIAVMIGITGLNLFISSIISFVKKSDIKHVVFWNWCYEKLNNGLGHTTGFLFGKTLKLPTMENISLEWFRGIFSKKVLAIVFAVLILVYLFTGITLINPDETGVKLRFGKIVNENMQPGIHYLMPWPFETARKVNAKLVYRVELGFRTNERIEGSISSMLWEEKHTMRGYKKNKTESTVLTGDENLADLSLVVHYRPKDAVRHVFRINNVDEVLRGLLESNMREVLSTESGDDLLTLGRKVVTEKIHQALNKDLDKLDLGVEIVEIYCHDFHPPMEVVGTYRDVFSAREDRAKLLNKAQSYRNKALPEARAESTLKLANAYSLQYEKGVMAQGEAEKFKLESNAYKLAPDLTTYRMFLETVEKGFAGKKKIVADPAVNRGGYRMWLFSPRNNPLQTNKK